MEKQNGNEIDDNFDLNNGIMEVQDSVIAANDDALLVKNDVMEDVESQQLLCEIKTHIKSCVSNINDVNDPLDNKIGDEFTVRFSAAQIKAKVAQAKHEAKLVADAELLEVKKELIERSYEAADLKRERNNVVVRLEAVQARLDIVLQEQQEMLCGMPEDLRLKKLSEALDIEKVVRQKFQEVFEKQQKSLAMAQERVKKLDEQVASYQKTETVLAQSVAHLQHRFASKDEQRAASVEHVQEELIQQHEQEMAVLREELAIARNTEKMAQKQLQELQRELRANVQQKSLVQAIVVTDELELQAKITKLETEKAVLRSKAEQVQKADAQLRSQLHAQSEEIATLQQEIEKLQRDNKELGEIASDLMQMAERQHCESGNRGIIPARPIQDASAVAPRRTYEEDEIFLLKRKKRLRSSLG